MATRTLTKFGEGFPTLFGDFFRPWNDLFDNRDFMGGTLKVPAVNIKETKDDYSLSLAVPGMKKDDFKIDIEGNMITISCEKEESKEEKEAKYTRNEYNYTSFNRSFTLPDEINKEKIDARYEDGILKLVLPKKEEVKKTAISKHIAVK
jgi:HSP20 family protein